MILVALTACLIYVVSDRIRSNYGTMITAISDHTGVAVRFILAAGAALISLRIKEA